MSEEGGPGVRFIIEGRVQGVGFRWWARSVASELGLRGWVRNRRDGTVEVWARGPEGELAAFRRRLREGPPPARVKEVREEMGGPEAGAVPEGFEIRR